MSEEQMRAFAAMHEVEDPATGETRAGDPVRPLRALLRSRTRPTSA